LFCVLGSATAAGDVGIVVDDALVDRCADFVGSVRDPNLRLPSRSI